jgi:uncharacterized repeat protein (TIGR01451 family)
VTGCVGKELTVTKTATGTFDRTYFWKIDKSVDDTRIEIPEGGTATFNYTVKVTTDGYTDSGWTLGGTITVSDSSSWSTNLFQPAVEILKSGTANATPGQTITYTFTINNLSSDDSPNLKLDSVSDNVLGDLITEALAAGCDNLVYNGSCTFTKDYTIPDGPTPPALITNVVNVHFHPAGFPNDIHDSDDHTVTIVNQGQLTDTSYCLLPNNQFRLLYHNETIDTYRLQSSNPGQFYYNAFYFGETGEVITMTIKIPYPFVTQEGAGNPIQVHDGSGMTSSGCYAPWPSVTGFEIATAAMSPTSPAGNQIITPEDYATREIGSSTIVTVSGVVPSSGVVYVTIHLDYGLKKTGGWMKGSKVNHRDFNNSTSFPRTPGATADAVVGFQFADEEEQFRLADGVGEQGALGFERGRTCLEFH